MERSARLEKTERKGSSTEPVRKKSHKKQVLTYLKSAGHKPGNLLNFEEALMKDGISKIINHEIE